jgi:hypothetical protein
LVIARHCRARAQCPSRRGRRRQRPQREQRAENDPARGAPADDERRHHGRGEHLRGGLSGGEDALRGSLARVFPRRPPAAARALAAHPRRELRRIAGEIETAFARLVEPHWQRMRSVLDADIVHRARTLAGAGAARMFEQLHTGVSWHGDHLLLTDASGIEGDPDVAAVGPGGLVLEPSVFIWPRLYVKRRTATRTTIRYPTRGVELLWDPEPAAAPDALARLLGERRAQILTLLGAPHTTAELARRLRITPSAVSQHLTPLRNAGLVASEDLGRQRLHMASPLGAQLTARPQ